MRRLLYPILIAAGLVAAVAGPAAAAPAAGGTSVVVRSAAAASCYDVNWPRPTTGGWKKDPCADALYLDYDEGGVFRFRLLTGVDYQWSMSGGAHITGARAWGRFKSYNGSYPTGKVTEVRLGRVPPFSGVVDANTTDSAWDDDSIQWTAGIPGVGCGSTDGRRIGSTSYQLWSHMWGVGRSTGGTEVANDFIGATSYYYFAADGKC